jgi:sorting nexin-1/2
MKQKVEELHQEFIDISKLIKNELDRFDKEKVEDFRDSVEQFLKSMIEHQKEVKKKKITINEKEGCFSIIS